MKKTEKQRRGFALCVEECQLAWDWGNTADALYHLALEYAAAGEGEKEFIQDNSDLCDLGALGEAWKVVRLGLDPLSAVGRIERWYQEDFASRE